MATLSAFNRIDRLVLLAFSVSFRPGCGRRVVFVSSQLPQRWFVTLVAQAVPAVLLSEFGFFGAAWLGAVDGENELVGGDDHAFTSRIRRPIHSATVAVTPSPIAA